MIGLVCTIVMGYRCEDKRACTSTNKHTTSKSVMESVVKVPRGDDPGLFQGVGALCVLHLPVGNKFEMSRALSGCSNQPIDSSEIYINLYLAWK